MMIITTTPSVEGKKITEYKEVVAGEAIMGANVFRDFVAGLNDFFGGRASTYEKKLTEAREICMQEMSEKAEELGANAIVGVDIDYETVGQGGSMLMVTVSGTAVKVE